MWATSINGDDYKENSLTKNGIQNYGEEKSLKHKNPIHLLSLSHKTKKNFLPYNFLALKHRREHDKRKKNNRALGQLDPPADDNPCHSEIALENRKAMLNIYIL